MAPGSPFSPRSPGQPGAPTSPSRPGGPGIPPGGPMGPGGPGSPLTPSLPSLPGWPWVPGVPGMPGLPEQESFTSHKMPGAASKRRAKATEAGAMAAAQLVPAEGGRPCEVPGLGPHEEAGSRQAGGLGRGKLCSERTSCTWNLMPSPSGSRQWVLGGAQMQGSGPGFEWVLCWQRVVQPWGTHCTVLTSVESSVLPGDHPELPSCPPPRFGEEGYAPRLTPSAPQATFGGFLKLSGFKGIVFLRMNK